MKSVLFPFADINITLDQLTIDPFETAFVIGSDLNKVKVNGDITQGTCSSFRPIRVDTIIPMVMPMDNRILTQTVSEHSCCFQTYHIFPQNREEIWLNRPTPLLQVYNRTKLDWVPSSNRRSLIIITVSAVYLIVVLVSVSCYMWRIDQRYKLIKFQGETPFFSRKSFKTRRQSRPMVRMNGNNHLSEDTWN